MENKYASYSSTTLAGEDSFTRWVLYGENEMQWTRWIEQHTEKQEIIDEAKRIVLSLSAVHSGTLTEAGKRELWDQIHGSILSASPSRTAKKITPRWVWALSAAAALTLVIWINSLTASQQFFAQAGAHKEIMLPEESAVSLNSESNISFRQKTFEENRIVRLDGEAFFKVKPGSTFVVETDYGTVTVLGTSFNVLARDGRFEVSCYTGKVKVAASDKEELVITAGEQSIKGKADESMRLDKFIPISDSPEWTSGKFNFDDRPLAEVVAELERQYAIRVKLDAGLEKLKYTGLFETGDLDTALYLITWPLHLKSTVKGKTVTISR